MLSANRAPVLSPIDNQTVPADAHLNITLSATDPDGDPLGYSVGGNTFSSYLTGNVFHIFPGPLPPLPASYQVTFSVADGRGGSDSRTVTITFVATNRPPSLSVPAGPPTVVLGSNVTLNLSAMDPDGD